MCENTDQNNVWPPALHCLYSSTDPSQVSVLTHSYLIPAWSVSQCSARVWQGSIKEKEVVIHQRPISSLTGKRLQTTAYTSATMIIAKECTTLPPSPVLPRVSSGRTGTSRLIGKDAVSSSHAVVVGA